jgi:hypothetical protein
MFIRLPVDKDLESWFAALQEAVEDHAQMVLNGRDLLMEAVPA